MLTDHHSVICLATSRAQAETIVEDLRMSEFSDNHISLVLPDEHDPHIPHLDTSREEAPAPLPGMKILAMSDGAPFLAAGPLLDTMCGNVAFCGIAQGLICIGIPAREAKRYERRLHKGNILIAVHSEDSEEVGYAKMILKAGLAKEICTSSAWSLPGI